MITGSVIKELSEIAQYILLNSADYNRTCLVVNLIETKESYLRKYFQLQIRFYYSLMIVSLHNNFID